MLFVCSGGLPAFRLCFKTESRCALLVALLSSRRKAHTHSSCAETYLGRGVLNESADVLCCSAPCDFENLVTQSTANFAAPTCLFFCRICRECSTHHVSLHFQCAGIGVLPTGMLRCAVSSSASFASHLPRSPAADAAKCFHPIFGGEAHTRTHVSPRSWWTCALFSFARGEVHVCSFRLRVGGGETN